MSDASRAMRASQFRELLEDTGPSWRNKLARLNERERGILEARLKGATLEEVGPHFGITRERVRQIQNKTLRLMKFYMDDLTA